MTLSIFNLLLRRSDGSTEELEFVATTPSRAATHAVMKASATRPSIDAVLVIEADMVWIPRYGDWQHLLPYHMAKNLPLYEFEGHSPLVAAPIASKEAIDALTTRVTEPAYLDVKETLATPAMTRAQARDSGYTGDACVNCQSIRMKRNGSCMVCEDCGTTTGCS